MQSAGRQIFRLSYMREKDFQTKLTRWAKHNLTESCAIEAKITHTKRLPFNAVLPHQRQALLHANHGTLAYKIPDIGFGQKPFDMVVLANAKAYVAVMFYARGVKHFYLIPIDAWQKAAMTRAYRSITEPEVATIGQRHELARAEPI